jgi:hypothetical protein
MANSGVSLHHEDGLTHKEIFGKSGLTLSGKLFGIAWPMAEKDI